MSVEKKAFKVVYGLIVDGVISEKEAFNLIEGIFAKEYYPVPVPTTVDTVNQENSQENAVQQVEVKGFVNNY